jgi:hypothetical protein
MDVLAMVLMVFPVIGLSASGIIVVLMVGISGYSLLEWWQARKKIAREVPIAKLEEKLPA